MKVFDCVCDNGHRFEGWFPSGDADASVACPLCDSADVKREPSAPRVVRGGDPAPAARSADAAQAAAVALLRRIVAGVENVGARFAEEARRIHYDEAPARAIRGTATDGERRALEDEGIETLSIALPVAVTDTLQ